MNLLLRGYPYQFSMLVIFIVSVVGLIYLSCEIVTSKWKRWKRDRWQAECERIAKEQLRKDLEGPIL